MAAIKKRSLVDQVYERLRADIVSLRLPLGSKVNVNELQDILGVSCTPIREAINRLQQEGLVTYENNVGARVLTLTPKTWRRSSSWPPPCTAPPPGWPWSGAITPPWPPSCAAASANSSPPRAPRPRCRPSTISSRCSTCTAGTAAWTAACCPSRASSCCCASSMPRRAWTRRRTWRILSTCAGGVEQGDAEAVCAAIVGNSDRLERAVSDWLVSQAGA